MCISVCIYIYIYICTYTYTYRYVIIIHVYIYVIYHTLAMTYMKQAHDPCGMPPFPDVLLRMPVDVVDLTSSSECLEPSTSTFLDLLA